MSTPLNAKTNSPANLQGTVLQAGHPAVDALVSWHAGTVSSIFPTTPENVDNSSSAFILPGLIDSHDHLAFKRALWETEPQASHLMGELMHSDSAQMWNEFETNAKRILASGVTTVRDFGVDLGAGLFYAQNNGVSTPRILTCRAPLGTPGGHLHHRARPVTNSEEVKRLVLDDVRTGVPWIKLFASGGIANFPQDPITVELAEELMRAATETAHAHGLRVAAHALPEEAVLKAVRAGVDSIEHGVFLSEETAQLMAERGVWYVPTLAGYIRRVRGLRATGQHEAADAFERDVISPHSRSVRLAHSAGVRIAVGTDITASVVDEMEALMEVAGLEFDDVLAAATTAPAELLGLEDGTGNVQVNARADMIVIRSDPRRNIRALDDVATVVTAGELIPL